MTVSKLSCKNIWSPNCGSRNGKKICKFTPHYMAGDLTVERCGDVFKPKSRQASSTYGIGSDGRIACYVDEESRPWTSSSSANDSLAITVEVANTSNVTGQITDAAWKSLVKLATDVCYRYGFRLKWTGNSSGSLTCHYMFSDTSCPGPYLKKNMARLAKEVNDNLDKKNTSFCGSVNTKSSYSKGSSGSGGSDSGSGDGSGGGGEGRILDSATAYAYAINHNVVFSREETYPYMITIDQNTSTLDYSLMKDSDIVAVCIDMGQYYNANHTVRANFCQPKFDAQCQLAIDKKFPFAVYTNIYAKTTKEVELEVEQMRFPLRRFPPKLGLWLVPHFGTNKRLNDTLIEKYQELLEKLGFKGQIGFYCAAEDLKYTSWKDKHCDSWYWWMNRHMKKLDSLKEGMPQPEFFKFEKPEDELMLPDFEAAENVSLGGSGSGGSTDGYGGSKEANAKLIWSALTEICGLSNKHVAGALSNFEAESSIDPTCIETIYNEPYTMGTRKTEAAKDFNAFKSKVQAAYANSNLGYSINWSAYTYNGKFCPGIGIVQWTGSGGVKLRECADKVAGGKWWNLDFQVAYMIAKGAPTGAMGGKNFFKTYASMNFSSGEAAARTFTKFENGAMPSAQVSSHIKTANGWVSKMGSWTKDESFNKSVQGLVNAIKG